jgi:hypothetical protein
MTSFKQLIQTSPVRANDLFAKLIDTSEGAIKTRQRLFGELKEELDFLAKQEEQHLFPALKKHKELKNLVREAVEDNRHTKTLLDEIEHTSPETEEFASKVVELKKVFQQHVRDDKKELLPAVRKVLSDDETASVVEKIETQKAELEETKRAEAQERRAEARRVHKSVEQAERAIGAVDDLRQELSATGEQIAQGVVESIAQGSDQAAHLFGVEAGERFLHDLPAVSRAWLELWHARLQRNLDDMVAIARSRTFPELIGAQASMIHHNIAMLIENSQHLIHSSMRISHSAGQRVAGTDRMSARTR